MVGIWRSWTPAVGTMAQFMLLYAFFQAYDFQKKIPSRTLERLIGSKFVDYRGGVTESFDPDTDLPVMFQTRDADFDLVRQHGFHAGPIAPAANYQRIRREYRDAFWYSNAVAMNHKLNQGAWRRIENRARAAAGDLETASTDGRCYALTVCALRRYIYLLIIIIVLLTKM